ncbi:hypothetical protein M3182_09635 [Mesobacillus maritimus]|uniref:hypothetical protein n=1 Tax=Mesobacillus maritimus TaxID=1643336 RepID=UPI00203FA493|nr:hypothetical protein [Mesobacillus maritimus]MCM3585986.1 hypothetical protein [Mesobacillus maritimus]MCM3670353.1 hypothetical protein [Mesobacillus maritimus]
MSLEWFDRVTGELQDHLESICEKYDQTGHMSIDRSAKHPRIEFFVETEENERDYFCTLFFDPHNEEFYVETFDVDFEQPSRTILSDIENIVDAVHESFHEFLNEDDTEIYYVDEVDEDDYQYLEEIEDNRDEYYVGEIIDDSEDIFEEIDVEWETPEVTAFQKEDEVEVTYQFGIVNDTGDGVLRRINRIWTEDDELIKDESNFIFTKEEASTIIAMIASHMDSLIGYDDMI